METKKVLFALKAIRFVLLGGILCLCIAGWIDYNQDYSPAPIMFIFPLR